MKLSNLTTRNIGLDIAYIYGVRGDYYGYRSGCRGDRMGKGVCLCKQETRVDRVTAGRDLGKVERGYR